MDLENVLDQYKIATSEFLKGNPDNYKRMFSHSDDVTLSNPMYPTVRGWDKVSETLDKTASRLREGEFIRVNTISKYITPALAYLVSIAEEKTKIDGSQDIKLVTLRTTMILRPEDNTWKIVHLHGEFIAPPKPAM